MLPATALTSTGLFCLQSVQTQLRVAPWAAPLGALPNKTSVFVPSFGDLICNVHCHLLQTQPRMAPWPAPLGALPCETSVPVTIVRAAAAAQLFCLATLPQQQEAEAAGKEPAAASSEDCMVALSLM